MCGASRELVLVHKLFRSLFLGRGCLHILVKRIQPTTKRLVEGTR